MAKRLFIYLVAAITFASCLGGAEEYNSTLVFRPAQQLASGEEFIDLDGVKVYAFAADTTYYAPASYDDALAGVVTDKITGETLSPFAVGEEYIGYYSYIYETPEEDEDDEDEEDDEIIIYPYEDGEVVETTITGVALQATMSNVMLLAVDTENMGYAYCNYAVGLNLKTTYITLSFRPWRSESFAQGVWWYVVPEVDDTLE